MPRGCSGKALFVAVALAVLTCGGPLSCGGGGGGELPGDGGGGNSVPGLETTVFDGGGVDELRALSADLSFNRLEIRGSLQLPIGGGLTTISANSFYLASGAGIRYSYSECEYRSAPSLEIVAAGDVDIEGEILLGGRSGTRVTSSAICKSCYGEDGGSLSIVTQGSIRIKNRVLLTGGGGGTSVDSYGSSGCSGGDSGELTLRAHSIDLTGSNIDTDPGRGGYGCSFGNCSYASSGTPGLAEVTAEDELRMQGGLLDCGGALSVQAARTAICGPIYYATLTDSIGGIPDTTPPSLTIVSPQPAVDVYWGDDLVVSLDVADEGMGIREIRVTGLGSDEVIPGEQVVAGKATMTIGDAQPPESLEVTVTDNCGLTTVASVKGVGLLAHDEIEANDTPSTAQVINFPDQIEGAVRQTDTSTTVEVTVTAGTFDMPIEDFYEVTVPEGRVGINLTTGGHDLDLYLWNDDLSTLWRYSVRDNPAEGAYYEYISPLLPAGTYIIGVDGYITTVPLNTGGSFVVTADYTLTVTPVED